MVTHDHDFLALAAQGVDHPGLCYSHQHSLSVRGIIEMLSVLYECFSAEQMHNRVEFL